MGNCGDALCCALDTPATSGTAAIAARNAPLRMILAARAATMRLRENLRMNFSFPACIQLSEWVQRARSTQYRKKQRM